MSEAVVRSLSRSHPIHVVCRILLENCSKTGHPQDHKKKGRRARTPRRCPRARSSFRFWNNAMSRSRSILSIIFLSFGSVRLPLSIYLSIRPGPPVTHSTAELFAPSRTTARHEKSSDLGSPAGRCDIKRIHNNIEQTHSNHQAPVPCGLRCACGVASIAVVVVRLWLSERLPARR